MRKLRHAEQPFRGAAPDRVGIVWRPEIAAAIFAHLDEIDFVEVIADDYFGAPKAQLSALRTLASQVPISLHGVGAGMASTEPVAGHRLDSLARLVNELRPESWSEHLAFVRGGGYEIGHLACPPRNQSTVCGAAVNLERARQIVGSAPLMENVATLIDPPGSDMSELHWLNAVLLNSDCGLLLDLHNLHSNAVNFHFSATDFLDGLPLERVQGVHIAGGTWISSQCSGERRMLDDHLHPVPPPVYELLTRLAARASQPLTVVLERDGAFPPMQELLAELRSAREAIKKGRQQSGFLRAAHATRPPAPLREGTSGRLEALLAQLYVSAEARKEFVADPARAGAAAGLAPHEIAHMASMDRIGLEMAARSFHHKREKKEGRRVG